MRFQNKFYKFMYGRYGMDELYNFLFFLYIFIIIIDMFVGSDILFLIESAILIVTFYRFFSKNIDRRRKENMLYLKLKNQVVKPFKNIKRNYKDRNNYVYKKCGKCNTILRLPLPPKRGFRYAKCPGCKRKVRIFALRKQKIEVIRKDDVKC